MKSQTNGTNRAICFCSLGFSALSSTDWAIFHSYMVTVVLQVFPGAVLHGSRENIIWFQTRSDVKCWQRLADILLLAEVIQCCLSGGRWWNNFTLLACPFSLQFLIHHQIHKVHFINDFYWQSQFCTCAASFPYWHCPGAFYLQRYHFRGTHCTEELKSGKLLCPVSTFLLSS